MDIMVILYVATFIAGFVFIGMAISQYLKAKKAETTWPTAGGVVLESMVKSARQNRSSSTSSERYWAKVSYQYQVNGQSYTCDQLNFGNATLSENKAKAKVDLYPRGANVTVHYDPANPAKAVLETKASGFTPMLLAGIMLIVLGLMIAFWL